MSSKDLVFTLNGKTETSIQLIDGKKAITEFSKIDNFLSSLSEFDLQSRLQTSESVKVEQYIEFINKQVLNWEEKYIDEISTIIADLNKQEFTKLCPFPSEIFILLTNGQDESNAAYCRNSQTIVLPSTVFGRWKTILKHELFHILSRNNEKLRDELYQCIGYYRIPENKNVHYPVKSLQMTNPDAPIIQHYIKLKSKNSEKELALSPLLYAAEKYSHTSGKNFFSYLKTTFIVLDEKSYEATDKLVSYDEVDGFYEKIGRNTSYIIHPEEILADNFVFLLQNNFTVATPSLLKSLRAMFEKHAKA